MEVVWLVPTGGNMDVVYFGQRAAPPPHGLGRVRPEVSIFLRVFDPDLRSAADGVGI